LHRGFDMTLTNDQVWERLARDLNGRMPEFIREPNMAGAAHNVMWLQSMLPSVFVSPDVFSALAKKEGTAIDYSGKAPRLTLPFKHEENAADADVGSAADQRQRH
jgi:hypothetical protein